MNSFFIALLSYFLIYILLYLSLVTGILGCKGMDLPQTNKEFWIIFSIRPTFVLFYMLKSIMFSDSYYLCGRFLIINVITYTTMVNYKDLGLVNTKEMFAKPSKADTQFRLSTLTTWNRCRPLSRLLLKQNLR